MPEVGARRTGWRGRDSAMDTHAAQAGTCLAAAAIIRQECGPHAGTGVNHPQGSCRHACTLRAQSLDHSVLTGPISLARSA